MMLDAHYQIVTTPEALQKVFAVRAIVFIEEQNVPYDIEIDGLDFSSVHFLGTIGDEPVAAARMYNRQNELCRNLKRIVQKYYNYKRQSKTAFDCFQTALK